MLAAQEMFRDANKVTKPEKALILGFMAGARGTLYYCMFILLFCCISIKSLPSTLVWDEDDHANAPHIKVSLS